jgi:monoamine oxidase
LIDIGLNSVAHIFDKPVDDLRNITRQSYVYNWLRDEESLGAYSYSTTETASARRILNKPLAETVFFAGEGLNDGENSATVEAALQSGSDVAAKLLKILR